MNTSQTKVKIGDIYWIKLEDHIKHPYVVINSLELNLLEACGITTNQNKVNMPGNVVLDVNEGNLIKPSIVDVANVIKIKETDLGEYIGKLSEKRVIEVKNGIGFLERSFFSN